MSKKKLSTWKIVSTVLAVLLIVSIFTAGFSSLTGIGSKLSKKEVSKKVETFLNENLLQGTTGSIENVEDIGGLYRLELEIAGKKYDSYVTKDGNLLFPTAIDLTQNTQTQQQPETRKTEEIPKTDKPVVDLFVMSFCPFGNQAENTLLPVYNLLKDKVNWNINYIVGVTGNTVNSLHGQKEVDQDMREACVNEDYGLDKFWDFITYVNDNCGSAGECWKEAANKAGISAEKIQNCVDERGLELMKENAQESNEAGASGSPTMIINGVKTRTVYQYGDSESYKETICSAFKNPPEECSETLDSSGSPTPSGSC